MTITLVCFVVPSGSVLGVFKFLALFFWVCFILYFFTATTTPQGQHEYEFQFQTFHLYMEGNNISIDTFNRTWFRCSTKGPKHCCNTAILNSKFTDVFIVVHTAPLVSTQSPAHVTGTFIYCYQRGVASWFVAIVYCIGCQIFSQQGPYFII